MKKKDFVLMIIILVFTGIIYIGNQLIRSDSADLVVIHIDGTVYGEYSLHKDQVIHIDNTNTLKIKDGKADMIDADCPDKLCVHQKAISKDGESIICLPNKVIVEMKSDKEGKLDAIAN